MNPLEQRIGYKFRNSLLLAEALTHPSLGHETQRKKQKVHMKTIETGQKTVEYRISKGSNK